MQSYLFKLSNKPLTWTFLGQCLSKSRDIETISLNFLMSFTIIVKEVKKNVKYIFLSICDVKVFLTFTFTEYGTVLTTILPVLFLYLNTVIVTAGDFEP
jgi:hypothetical protein